MLTVKHCTEPNQSGMLNNIFKNVLNLKIQKTKKVLTLNLLDRLTRLGIGVNEVEKCSRRIHEGGGRVKSSLK